MTIQKVETFEHDIANEILKKEATVSRGTAADALVADVQAETGKQPSSVSPLTVTLLVSLVVVVVLGALGYFGYTYFIASKQEAKPAVPAVRTPPGQNKAKLFEITFPEVNEGLGRYVTNTERTPFGFVISITDYAPVFSFVVKNEDVFAESIAKALNVTESRAGPYVFSDVTISNQNIRLGTSGSSTIAYAFVSNKLVISTSTDGITAASAIIK